MTFKTGVLNRAEHKSNFAGLQKEKAAGGGGVDTILSLMKNNETKEHIVHFHVCRVKLVPIMYNSASNNIHEMT